MYSGRFLLQAYAALQDNSHLLKDGIIAPSPGAGVQKLVSASGEAPTHLGENSVDIRRVRDCIAALGLEDHILDALIIVAPHTHWGNAPIVCGFEKHSTPQRYKIGPGTGTAPYSAITFAFSPEGAIPYEWADATCAISPDELLILWGVVETVNAAVTSQDWFHKGYPLGLTLNHKFKPCFASPVSSTNEAPGPEGDPFSYIQMTKSFDESALAGSDQVGWSARIPPVLTERDVFLLQKFEEFLEETRYTP